MKPKFIKTAADLQTKRRAICDGFLEQAIQKTEKAEPFIKEAQDFYATLTRVKSVEEVLALLATGKYRDNLAYACGFSDKAKSQLTTAELNRAIKKVLTRIYKEAGPEFRENILYRYLLTRGDALGGSMRNLTGSFAATKLTEKIIKRLSGGKKKIQIVKSKTGKVQRVIWNGRTLLFDVTPRLIGKNIDVILIESGDAETTEKELLADKSNYLALGELKGGIDPAGADEHWKTANSALGRIRTAFGRNTPPLFFIGAAIEAAMAKEIFKQLKTGKLAHAANLNEDEQLDDLVDWLLSL
jgi:type II restriction enzyme